MRLDFGSRSSSSGLAVLRTIVGALAVCGGGACIGETERTFVPDNMEDAGLTGADVNVPPAPKYTIGGIVSGLTGSGLVLQNNGGDNLAIAANGAFTFETTAFSGARYDVKVLTNPSSPAQGCAVAGATGTVGEGNVSNITVACSTEKFKVGGTLSGLPASASVVLQNNGGDNLVLTENGPFSFPTTLLSGTTYSVSVSSSPLHYGCTTSAPTGSVGTEDVTAANVACAINTYSIGGTATGVGGTGLVLLNATNGESLAISANGAFTFLTKVPSQGAYDVRVSAMPTDRSCILQNGAGSVGDAPVTSMSVSCQYTENFDGVGVPGLPADWTAAVISGNGTATTWVTVSGGSDTAPNNALGADPAFVTDNRLTSPSYAIQTAAAQLTFKHKFTFEASPPYYWDGGVLEVSIDGGTFDDIVTAGGAFAAGGYTTSGISSSFSNPLGNRAAWGGASAGYITTTVNLPASFAGKTAQFRWRIGTDSSNSDAGWNIDTIAITP
jgi:hypothetical protein